MMSRLARRRASRKVLRIPVSFGVDKCSQRGFITNISTTGVAVQTNRVSSPGTDLSLRIDLKGKVFDARGNVRWVRKTPPSMISRMPPMMGIQFSSFSDEGWLSEELLGREE